MESNRNGSRAKAGGDDEILVPNYVCCVVTEGVWVWFAAVLLFVVLMFIATLKVSQHTTSFTVRPIRSWISGGLKLTLIWVYPLGVPVCNMHVTQLPGFFCQIPVRPSRIGPTMEHLKFKSTQPSPRANGHLVNKLSTIVLKFMATCLTIVLSKAAIETQVFREE